ncbi:hypothetical protein Droror1_Dr00016534 [Drosera rotundifolia]
MVPRFMNRPRVPSFFLPGFKQFGPWHPTWPKYEGERSKGPNIKPRVYFLPQSRGFNIRCFENQFAVTPFTILLLNPRSIIYFQSYNPGHRAFYCGHGSRGRENTEERSELRGSECGEASERQCLIWSGVVFDLLFEVVDSGNGFVGIARRSSWCCSCSKSPLFELPISKVSLGVGPRLA